MRMNLTTSRLVLRPWTLDDAEGAFLIYGDPEVNRYLGGKTVESVDAMRETLGVWLARTARYPEGLGIFAAVAGDVIVGCGLLKPLPLSTDPPPPTPLDRVLSNDIEVGWHLGRDHWGKGYATEFAERLIQYGFETLGLAEIHCMVMSENHASQRVAQRCGFTHTGLTDRYYNLELEHYLRKQAPQSS